MKQDIKEIEINGTIYVEKDSICGSPAINTEGLEYTIIRSSDSGVHAGWLVSGGTTCVMRKARRLWRWSGAASLSELAMHGVKNPTECKFPCEVDSITVHGVCEEIPCTEKARLSIARVEIWSA